MASQPERELGTPFEVPAVSIGPGRKNLVFSDSRIHSEVLRLFEEASVATPTGQLDGSVVRESIAGYIAAQPDGIANANRIAEELLGLSPKESRYETLLAYLGELCRIGQLVPVVGGGYRAVPLISVRVSSATPPVAATAPKAEFVEPTKHQKQKAKQKLDSMIERQLPKNSSSQKPQIRHSRRARKWR